MRGVVGVFYLVSWLALCIFQGPHFYLLTHSRTHASVHFTNTCAHACRITPPLYVAHFESARLFLDFECLDCMEFLDCICAVLHPRPPATDTAISASMCHTPVIPPTHTLSRTFHLASTAGSLVSSSDTKVFLDAYFSEAVELSHGFSETFFAPTALALSCSFFVSLLAAGLPEAPRVCLVPVRWACDHQGQHRRPQQAL